MLISFIHSFILYLPYIQNFTMQGWNNEIKEKVKVRRPERNHEAYNKSGLLNLG